MVDACGRERSSGRRLNAEAKAKRSPEAVVKSILEGMKLVEIVRQPTPVEMMASVYRDVKTMRKQAAAARRVKTAAMKRQGDLL